MLTGGLAIIYFITINIYYYIIINKTCKQHEWVKIYYPPKDWKNIINKKEYIDEFKIPEKIIFQGLSYKLSPMNNKTNPIKKYFLPLYKDDFYADIHLFLDIRLKKILYLQSKVTRIKIKLNNTSNITLNGSTLDKFLYEKSLYPCGNNDNYISEYLD